MTETTRSNLASSGGGSRVWYQGDDSDVLIPLKRVRKVTTRMGDDAKVQGPFKLSASEIVVEQIHNDPEPLDQRFEYVASPGSLLNIDGQTGTTVHGTEMSRAIVDKVSEKLVDKTTVEREIVARGLWAQVVGRKGSTAIHEDILVSDAIRIVLDAIEIPYGEIEETPNAVLSYFWLSDRQDPSSVLAGLVEAAGPRARLDDYTGVITFSAEPSGVERIIVYGGSDIGGFSLAPEDVAARTEEGVGPYSTTSRLPRYGVIPDNFLYGGFKHFQGEMFRRIDHATGVKSWALHPNSVFEYEGNTYTIETVQTGYDELRRRYYIEAALTSSTMEGAFSQRTFRRSSGAIVPIYFNWYINDKRFLRKAFTGVLQHATWDTNEIRLDELADSTVERDWQFHRGEIREGTVHVGWYRNEITQADAEALGAFGMILTPDWDSYFELVEPPSDSRRLIFHDYKRNDDDSRYFNAISVPSVSRDYDEVDSDLWEAPEPISVVANATLDIRVTSTEGTPFVLAEEPFSYTENDNLDSIVPDKQSGAEITLSITAGDSDLELENLVVRGRYFVPVFEQQVVKAADDEDIAWVPAGDFPEGLSLSYLRSWADARLNLGLERRWTTSITVFAWDSGKDDFLRNNWQTWMRLRPGRLIRFDHGREIWFGLVREIRRTSGSAVDHVDRYEITCELTGIDAFDPDVFRLGLSTYGSDQVLG